MTRLAAAASLLLAVPAAASIGAAGGPAQRALTNAQASVAAASGAPSGEAAAAGLQHAFDNNAAAPAVAAGQTAGRKTPAKLQAPPAKQADQPPPLPPLKADDGASKTQADKEAAHQATELKRAAVGGVGGALVLGIFGFIFGGPAGALLMAAVGAAVFGGLAYLNNNPFK